jgi:hypothetical protein
MVIHLPLKQQKNTILSSFFISNSFNQTDFVLYIGESVCQSLSESVSGVWEKGKNE